MWSAITSLRIIILARLLKVDICDLRPENNDGANGQVDLVSLQ